MHHFLLELNTPISESTIRDWKKKYCAQLKLNKDSKRVTGVYTKTRGRPRMLGELDMECQNYIRKIRLTGGIVNRPVIAAAMKGIVKARKPSLLRENGGPINIGRGLVQSFIKRLGYVKRKGTKAARNMPYNFEEIKNDFMDRIRHVIKKGDIPDDLIINFDQTGSKIIPVSQWTLEIKGKKQVCHYGY